MTCLNRECLDHKMQVERDRRQAEQRAADAEKRASLWEERERQAQAGWRQDRKNREGTIVEVKSCARAMSGLLRARCEMLRGKPLNPAEKDEYLAIGETLDEFKKVQNG